MARRDVCTLPVLLCKPSRAGFLYPFKCWQTPRTALWGPLICLSFPRHKWPILRAIELCLKNVKCMWKLHISADARSRELSYFHGQPPGRTSARASRMLHRSVLSRPPGGNAVLIASSGQTPRPDYPSLVLPVTVWPCGSRFIIFIVFPEACEGNPWGNQNLHFLQLVIMKFSNIQRSWENSPT